MPTKVKNTTFKINQKVYITVANYDGQGKFPTSLQVLWSLHKQPPWRFMYHARQWV